jgi:hypothetical protein
VQSGSLPRDHLHHRSVAGFAAQQPFQKSAELVSQETPSGSGVPPQQPLGPFPCRWVHDAFVLPGVCLVPVGVASAAADGERLYISGRSFAGDTFRSLA